MLKNWENIELFLRIINPVTAEILPKLDNAQVGH